MWPRVLFLLSIPGMHHKAHLCVCETSPKLITAYMQENISHDQCQSGGGKNKQSCFHSFHPTNISAACISELSLSPVTSSRAGWDSAQPMETSRSGERKTLFRLETAVPVFSRYTNTIWEFKEFAKRCYSYSVSGRGQA